jgi:hypothetical protein
MAERLSGGLKIGSAVVRPLRGSFLGIFTDSSLLADWGAFMFDS